jgi:hypothetical protein
MTLYQVGATLTELYTNCYYERHSTVAPNRNKRVQGHSVELVARSQASKVHKPR